MFCHISQRREVPQTLNTCLIQLCDVLSLLWHLDLSGLMCQDSFHITGKKFSAQEHKASLEKVWKTENPLDIRIKCTPDTVVTQNDNIIHTHG